MMCLVSTGQLFSETTLRVLTSPSSLLSVSPLPRLLTLVEKHTSPTTAIASASHSLTLPLLRTILMSHDHKSGSRDLKDSAVRVLCKAVHEFISTYDKVCVAVMKHIRSW